MLRVVVFTAMVLITSPSAAYCPQPSGLIPERYVDDVAEFLVCLHNEQTDSINEVKAMVNAHSEGMNDLEYLQRKVIELEARIAILERASGP